MLDTNAPATSLSEALLLVDRALLRIPQLTVFGVGVSYRYHREGKDVVAQQTKTQQATLYKEGSLRMVAVCADWIKARLLRKSFDPRISSYGLKHLVEEFRMGRGDADPFIHNGCFIAAAVGLGFEFTITGPNAVFEFRGAGVAHVQ
jgi:hypothetical protein